MSELVPGSFSSLLIHAFDELERNGSIFGLPSRKFSKPDPRRDTAIRVHGRRVAAPVGASAGPHTQMAQNLVLCWLGGARVVELKTVQAMEAITVPRPCIESRDVTLNVEWSQELGLGQSLEEYVRASMLIDMLAPFVGITDRPLFDLSVGYDLKGISSEPVVAFMRGMMDATPTVERLRKEIPARFAKLRETAFTTGIASTITLSTFHGCPVSEIESIADFVMSEIGLDCTIKLNPTLLGAGSVHDILHEMLGFNDIHVPPTVYANDPAWDDAAAFIDRLQRRARVLGRQFSVKLTNTLVVENNSAFLPLSEKFAYLSGAPLHVLAMNLVRRFRRTFGASLPISFSAGIDRTNYADAVSLGLTPVTVCSDLLKQGGYGRLQMYGTELARKMDESGSLTIDDFIRRARGRVTRSLAEAIIWNTEDYVAGLENDPRYRNRRMVHPPKPRERKLRLFDCSTCDLCLAACPNAAIFELPTLDSGLNLGERHQIAVFADWCNDCGNCEVFCPDLGAPNRLKPVIFTDEERWRNAPRDAFFISPDRVVARIDGRECTPGTAPTAVFPTLDYLRRAVFDPARVNPINAQFPEER